MPDSRLGVDIAHEFAESRFCLRAKFDCPAGWSVLFGASGAGKSSILRAVAGLMRPQRGQIHFDEAVWMDSATGKWLSPAQRNIGYVAQNPALFPHLSVEENVGFSRLYTRDAVDIAALLAMFHCSHLASRRPQDLSGGEQQRVALARALARQPQLLLLDEPFRGLDAELRAAILSDLIAYLARHPVPVLSVTHDLIEILTVDAHVFRIRDGQVIGEGPAREILATEREAMMSVLNS